MKNKKWCLVLSLLIGFMTTAGCAGNITQPPARSLSDPSLPTGYVVLDRQTGDVTGDGKPKDILLIGRKPNADSNFTDDLSIIVQDGAGQNAATVKLPNAGGYNSKLFIGDFSGDKVPDVFVTIPSGGSGGYIEHRIVTFTGTPKFIFDEKENSGITATGHFIDGFRVELSEETTRRKALIDVSNKKDAYIKAGIYDAAGKLLREQSVSVGPLGELSPVDVDSDGIYELRGIQRVIGIYNADTVGYLHSIWKYENQKWTAKQIEVSSVLLGYGEK